MAALFGAAILISLTIMTEKWTKKPMLDSTQHALARNGLAEISIRNAEAIASMGMSARIAGRWAEANRRYMLLFHDGADITPGPSTYHRFWFRDAAYMLAAMDRYGQHAEVAHAGVERLVYGTNFAGWDSGAAEEPGGPGGELGATLSANAARLLRLG